MLLRYESLCVQLLRKSQLGDGEGFAQRNPHRFNPLPVTR